MTRSQKRDLMKILVTAVLLAAVSFIPAEGLLRLALYAAVYLLIGFEVLKKAVINIKNGQVFDENFLMAVATLGAMALGEYPEAVFVMLFYQVGELFEHVAVGRSRRSIAALMDIRPDYANLETGTGTEEVDPDEVPVGSVILVKPGEKVPLDGVVLEGTSSLNTTALTGESVPRSVGEGDEIVSGCVNMTGSLRVRTTRAFGESTVAKILDLVENSASNKARSEAFITRFARYYTPAVVFGALALAVIPSLADGQWAKWIHQALTFLVVSCPCALVLSVPLSFFGGIGGASRSGILVKGSNFLEELSQAQTVVFDKTGTLTKGAFEVIRTEPAGVTEAELLEMAALAECDSGHPIAQSLQRACGKGPDRSRVSEIHEDSGRGVAARVDGRLVLVGNRRLMEENGVVFSEVSAPETVIYVAEDGVYRGAVIIGDEPKPEAAEVIADLTAHGIRTVMLTGDRRETGESVAARLGVSEVHTELLPGDKVALLERLLDGKRGKGKVLFCGDGINDAPVLARADVGVAMGALGSDAAIEAADVVLMDDDLRKLGKAMAISRRTNRIVTENITFALLVKAVVLVLGLLGRATMWMAVFADVGVLVLAILNAMRALKTE